MRFQVSREVAKTLFPRVVHANQARRKRDELQHLMGGEAHAKWEDILVTAERAVIRKLRYVRRVFQVTVPFCGYKSRIVRSRAFKAAPFWTCNSCRPVRIAEFASRVPHKNSAIDHRNQMGVCDMVQNAPCPGPIDAAEDDIAI